MFEVWLRSQEFSLLILFFSFAAPFGTQYTVPWFGWSNALNCGSGSRYLDRESGTMSHCSQFGVHVTAWNYICGLTLVEKSCRGLDYNTNHGTK